MEIEFDPAKRALTLAERGLDFADATAVFDGAVVALADERFDYSDFRLAARSADNGRLDTDARRQAYNFDEEGQ